MPREFIRTVLRSGFLTLMLASATIPAFADARLQTVLALDTGQAAQVDAIQADYRLRFASVRQEYNRESRVLRRAERDHDPMAMERQQAITAKLRADMQRLQSEEDTAIRKLLTPKQNDSFTKFIAERDAMTGSSRDTRAPRDPH